MREISRKLILNAQEYSCHYKNGLSNHMPMAIFALDLIGASEEEIGNFYSRYERQLEKIKQPTEKVYEANWKNYLGDDQQYIALVIFFREKINQEGVDEILNIFVPTLFRGVSGAAFHPLIRLAYALEMNEESEIAHSLASWVVSYQELGELGSLGNENDLTLSLRRLKADFEKIGYKRNGYGIFNRLKQISSLDPFAPFNNSIGNFNLNVKEISEAAIELYMSTNDNFTALHTVTSSHALRVLSERMKLNETMISYFIQAFGAAYIDSGMPEIKSNFNSTNENWSDIRRLAQKSSNDHVFKFIYTCEQEFKFYQNNLFKLAAAKKSGLLKR